LQQDAKYNSFEDIKEQSNDDSCQDRSKPSTQKIGSEPILGDIHSGNTLENNTPKK